MARGQRNRKLGPYGFCHNRLMITTILNGTLLDTLADIANSTNAALARFGFAPHPVPFNESFGHGSGDPDSVNDTSKQVRANNAGVNE